jgi:probable rRNA maturation factor
MTPVRFNYADVFPVSLRKKKAVKEFIVDLFKSEGKDLVFINYVFCSDSYLLEINQSFLQHDYLTDIITFDLSEGKGISSEVYISVDRVKENAGLHSVHYKMELLRVIFHGALHLCGYKDKKKSEITIIRQKEDYYLRLFDEIKK